MTETNELPPHTITIHDHPEPSIMQWSDLELAAVKRYAEQYALQARAQVQGEVFGYIHHFAAHDESGVLIDTTWEADGCSDPLPHPTFPSMWKWTHCTPFYTTQQPSVPDGLQWFTVAEHGLPEVGEVVVGGLWYTDPWLKPECATSFMWGQCRVVDTKHRDFKDGKQWLTFGPSHNQITHWARLNPPAMLAAKDSNP